MNTDPLIGKRKYQRPIFSTMGWSKNPGALSGKLVGRQARKASHGRMACANEKSDRRLVCLSDWRMDQKTHIRTGRGSSSMGNPKDGLPMENSENGIARKDPAVPLVKALRVEVR